MESSSGSLKQPSTALPCVSGKGVAERMWQPKGLPTAHTSVVT